MKGGCMGVAYPENLRRHVHGVEDTPGARMEAVSIQTLLE
jgi:hypothetical protein